ncbi:MAG TPA: serine/threonine-protein kinase [Kofleriaceae bacterium]|nr:serine/threonine-protein kinase [Kofleriaceae bacterium]
MTAREEFGSYIVYEQLGVGGMARVHVAESRNLRKRVALKRLLAHAADDPELVKSFIHEAKLVGNLKHANVAQTYDFGKVGETYYIAMEFVPGPTVGQLIRQCKATVGIVPFPITLNILCQVCDALAYAHNLKDEKGKSLGLIHRDVSPPNIIISNTGTVKLIDFGVAKLARSTMNTQVGTVKGKFSYMAPEYLNGQLDSRVDLWALGAVAHELLTNRSLFDAPDDVGVLEKVKRAPIPPPSRYNSDVPRDLDAVVLTALERNPQHRWQSAEAMRTALANVATELKTTVTNAQMMEWIEWAFTQKPGSSDEKTGVSQLIQLLEKPSKPGAKANKAASSPTLKYDKKNRDRDVDATSPEKPRARKRAISNPHGGVVIIDHSPRRPMLRRSTIGTRVVLWFFLIVLAGAAGFAVYRYGIPHAITRSF